MFGKRARVVYAMLWGALALPAGYLALILWGLARMDSGSVSSEPQLVVLWALPLILLASCIAEVFAARGADTPTKQTLARIFAFLPLGTMAIIATLILIR